MDLTSLYYFQELSKDLNMTKTAERLYISQQTLSNHIQRLEQYYGTKLFYRKPSLSLTCAGEFVLSFAQVVGKEERNLKDILSDVEHQERGTLRFGASMARGSQFLLIILPAFQRKYPRVEVRFVEGLSAKLEKQVANGEVDFAVVLSDRYNADLVEHEFLREEVYLCVPEVLLRQYYTPEEIQGIKERSVQGADLRDFARLPFSLMTNRLGGRIREQFRQAGVEPWACLAKLLFTAVTLSAGFKGGEVVPSFFVGATFGCVAGPLLGLPPGFAAAVGLIAVFCGAVNCPLASTFLSVELFGAEGLLYFAVACGVSYMLSGYSGLYSSQTILYSKLKAQYINVHTNAHHASDQPGERQEERPAPKEDRAAAGKERSR